MKLKKIALYVSIYCIFFACTDEEFQTIDNSNINTWDNGISDDNDPNLDPNWNWETGESETHSNLRSDLNPDINGQVKIFFPCTSCLGGINNINVPLPWNLTPDNVPNPDYKKVDGWELYLRDFGTSSRAANAPYFALYNKYTGILRFYLFNYLNRTPTGFKGTLLFSSNPNSLMAFTSEPENSTIETSTLNGHSERIVSTSGPYNSTWIRLDFPLVNYHPWVADNTQIQLVVDQILSFSGIADINLSQNQLGGNQKSKFNIVRGIDTGFNLSKSLADLIDSYNKLKKPAGDGNSRVVIPFEENYENKAIDPVSAFKLVSAGFGIIKSFIGNKKEESPQQLLQFSGFQNISLISERLTPYSISFIPRPNTPTNSSYYVPIYNKQIGIFNFQRNPEIFVNWTPSERRYQVSNFAYRINPDIEENDLELIERRIKVWDNFNDYNLVNGGDTKKSKWPWASHWQTFVNNVIIYPRINNIGYNSWGSDYSPKFATFEFTFKKKNYNGNFSNEVTFQKVLPLKQNIYYGF